MRKQPRRVLVTGAAGLLARKLFYLMAGCFEVLAVDIDKSPDIVSENFHPLDITDKEGLFELIREVVPSIVVHTAAFTNVDGCETERELAWRVNVEGTANVAQACREVRAKLIHLSSDYIFDGKEGPYSEDDQPNPISYYGLTKWESEREVRSILDDYVIARTTILYGYAPYVRPNFVTWTINMLSQGRKIKVVTDQVGSPTLADNVAEMIVRAIELDKRGVYNMVGGELIDRYGFGLKIAKHFDLDPSLIEPVTTAHLQQTAPRPLRAGLRMERTVEELGVQALGVDEGLKVVKSQMMGEGNGRG